MSDMLTEVMRELQELRGRVERGEALEFVRSQDSPTFIGLNVGSASGAGTGQVRASSYISAGGNSSNTVFDGKQHTSLANNGVAQVMNVASVNGLLVIVNTTSGAVGLISCIGGGHATGLISDIGSAYSITAGTAGKTNVYWSAGNARYEIENKTGAAVTYLVCLMGGT